MFSKGKDPAEVLKSETRAANKKVVTSPSIIASDLSILGNVISDGMVDMDGRLEGNIKCQQLIVRKNGIIKGDIIADSVHVYGRVTGLIKARMVSLFKACHVEGVIMHENLTIEEGAFVDGRFKRTDKLLLDSDKVDSVSRPSQFFRPEEESSDSANKTAEIRVLENLRLIGDAS